MVLEPGLPHDREEERPEPQLGDAVREDEPGERAIREEAEGRRGGATRERRLEEGLLGLSAHAASIEFHLSPSR